ncbi:polyphosphate:AMP phosphotransferase [Caenispirillum bisanense]|uniref:Polyphosphate:AMP phosphotransferase n=1 Tax=Caenispirillum bisanense TaxID=414052 RepID=A0A286H1A7_9PROT|nr:polyphosphate:AMP phosphotransferase [Caenispirillum bisanense]SOE01545.1 polyphosphate:AMP phosphotransferase [Caenispirillum bisanense]
MFRTAELGRTVSKEDFEAVADTLRIELVDLQQRLRGCDFPVVILFAGVDGAGKSETMNLLNEWMDPRWIVTRAYGEPSDEERERPVFWRYWRDLPPKGKMGLFLSAWYSQPLLDRAWGRIDEARFDERLNRIAAFEKELADDGALVLKFWMHLGKKEQKKRLKALEKDPHESWRVTDRDWTHWEMYEDFITASERLIVQTSMAHAPWQIVEGLDPRYRALTVLTAIRDAALRHIEAQQMRKRLVSTLDAREKKQAAQVEAAAEEAAGKPAGTGAAILTRMPSILSSLDMTRAYDKKDYGEHLQIQRARLNGLQRRARAEGVSSILVFEGWDAAGKGGAIRRLTAGLDARDYQVIPVAAPTDEERAHHYLWRFWRHLSRAGRVTIYDRSWYGRVLVERVEGFAAQEEWKRAYSEIRDFEEQLIEHGSVLVKFWFHITKEEQFARFKAREEIAYKKWKLTDEDWRNRERWDDYEAAVNEMIERTSTHPAPWTLVEANDKRWARVKTIETVCDALERRLG